MRNITQPLIEFQPQKVEILSIIPMEGRGALRAYVNVRIGPLIINDFRIVKEPNKRAWVSLPVQAWKTEYGTTKYRTIVSIEDENLKQHITIAILQAWEKQGDHTNGDSTK